MSYYVFGTGLSYPDYLQAKSFEDDLRSDISSHTRSIIASAEQLQREHISIISSSEELRREHVSISKQMAASIEAGFEQISFDLQGLSDGVSELNSTLHWGFSSLLTAVGSINDSIQQLIRVSQTPTQTWAYEQFVIARDAFRQELWDEAIEHLDRAIMGSAGHAGYKLEHRFHFLLGTIRLGSKENQSPSIVDMELAEQAFASAARYARRDYPHEAGRALLAAGWAAYCQGKMAAAQHYSEAALVADPTLGEAHFQLAKVLMHIGAPDLALAPLRRAIEIDRNYAIKAASDGDFQPHQDNVDALIEALREEARLIAQASLVAARRAFDVTEKLCLDEFPLSAYTQLQPAKSAIEAASRSTLSATYFGYSDAICLCRRADELLRQSVQEFVAGAKADCTKQSAKVHERIASCGGEVSAGSSPVLVFVLGVVISFFLGIHGCNTVRSDMEAERHRVFKANEARLISEGKLVIGGLFSRKDLERMGLYNGLPPHAGSFDGFGRWLSILFWGYLVSAGGAITSGYVIKREAEDRKSRGLEDLRAEDLRLSRVAGELERLLKRRLS